MPRYVIDCASDTHNTHKALKFKPPADLGDAEWFFVHAGDSTFKGTNQEVRDFAKWIGKLPHPHKVVIVGNHERETDPVWVDAERARIEATLRFKIPRDSPEYEILSWREQQKRERDRLTKLVLVNARGHLSPVCAFLHEEAVEIAGVRFYGSPFTPRFFSWGYQYDRDASAILRWQKIPEGTHVVITHGPPSGIMDEARDVDNAWTTVKAGCTALRRRIEAIKPQVHIFGHIHDWFGYQQLDGITFVNASSVTHRYESRFKFLRVYGSTETGVERVEVVCTT